MSGSFRVKARGTGEKCKNVCTAFSQFEELDRFLCHELHFLSFKKNKDTVYACKILGTIAI